MRRVIQIISGSRTGSSLLRHLLSKSRSVTSFIGEEEPYIKLSGNGYGMTSTSDSFTEFVNIRRLRQLLNNELEEISLFKIWKTRLSLQYKEPELSRLLNVLDTTTIKNPIECLDKLGIYGYYDGCPREVRKAPPHIAYEMPPYVVPKSSGRYTDTLLLKTPYNVYRPGLMEQVFPEAEFTYITMLRNPAATINGLIDGWKAPYGFHKHLTPFGWWKFDMPSGWTQYIGKSIVNKAWFQWHSSYKIISEIQNSIEVRFEELVTDTSTILEELCEKLGIETPEVSEIPLVMATEKPTPFRWKARAGLIEPLLVGDGSLISKLGYSNRELWI